MHRGWTGGSFGSPPGRRSTTIAPPGAGPSRPTSCRSGRRSPSGQPGFDGDLRAAVASLPPKQRVAVVHRHVLDRSYADVAEALGISEEAARANVYQGVKKLRELMK